jgi:hypothetical protein
MTKRNITIGALLIVFGITIGIAIGISISKSNIHRTSSLRPKAVLASNQTLDLLLLDTSGRSTSVLDGVDSKAAMDLRNAVRGQVERNVLEDALKPLDPDHFHRTKAANLDKLPRVAAVLDLAKSLNPKLSVDLTQTLDEAKPLKLYKKGNQLNALNRADQHFGELPLNLTHTVDEAQTWSANKQLNQFKVLKTLNQLNLNVLQDLTKQLNPADLLKSEQKVDTARVELLG